jgi:hypothetical protein
MLLTTYFSMSIVRKIFKLDEIKNKDIWKILTLIPLGFFIQAIVKIFITLI